MNVGGTGYTSPHLFKRRCEDSFRDLNRGDFPVFRAETIRDSQISSLPIFTKRTQALGASVQGSRFQVQSFRRPKGPAIRALGSEREQKGGSPFMAELPAIN
jgi:hypothetical protein